MTSAPALIRSTAHLVRGRVRVRLMAKARVEARVELGLSLGPWLGSGAGGGAHSKCPLRHAACSALAPMLLA